VGWSQYKFRQKKRISVDAEIPLLGVLFVSERYELEMLFVSERCQIE